MPSRLEKIMNAKEARLYSESHTPYFFGSIETAIMDAAINQGNLHCQWYSPHWYSLNDEEVARLKYEAIDLEAQGYEVKLEIFEPNSKYSCRQAKMYIHW